MKITGTQLKKITDWLDAKTLEQTNSHFLPNKLTALGEVNGFKALIEVLEIYHPEIYDKLILFYRRIEMK